MGQTSCYNIAFALDIASKQSSTWLMQIPFGRSGAYYGLVRLWNEVVELLKQGKSMKSAVQLMAAESGLGNTVIRNAIQCLGQVNRFQL